MLALITVIFFEDWSSLFCYNDTLPFVISMP